MRFNKIFQEYLNLTKPVKTTVCWYNLYLGHRLILNEGFKNKIFKRAINKAGNISELARKIRIDRKMISNVINSHYNPKIKTLIKIAEYINYPLDKINCEIKQIHGLKPKLPFNLSSEEGAEIRAAFLSDGHVDRYPTKQAQYCALEKELHQKLISLCKTVFGEFKCKTYLGNKSYTTKFPAIIGGALELSGVPRGNKTLSNVCVPKDILLGSKEIQISYLRRVFDDEGDVCFDKSGKRAIRLTRSTSLKNLEINIPPEKWTRINNIPQDVKNNLILGEQILLIKLGIDARLYPEGFYKNKNGGITTKWRIQIAQQDQLRKFAKLINFSLKRKKEKLNKILKSYQFRKLPNGRGKKEAFEFLTKLFKKKRFFRYNDLGKYFIKTGRSYDLAGEYLNFFIHQKMIKKIKRGIYVIDKS